MSLDELENEGYIQKLPVNTQKIQQTFRLAQRDIATAKTLIPTEYDWAFSIAYNAMLQTFRAFISSKGYRPAGGNQHIAVVRFAELFFDEEDIAVFDRMRRKRHATVYDTAGTISQQEAKHAIDAAETLIKKVQKMI